MYGENTYPLESYQELEPLCSKGHVMLVLNVADGQLYVKKRVQTHVPELYRQLRENPVPGTPVIHGIYPEDGTNLVIVETYIPGRTLAECLQEEGTFSESETIAIGMALCDILRELHSRRPAVIHRDIKPSNIIRQPDGRIVLLDFSAAKPENPRQSRDTVLIGTAGFAAPEQYGFSASTVQTDIYGMGVLLNTLRTGALPWEQRAGGHLRRIIDRCLKLEPKSRYIDARELQSALWRASTMHIEWLPPGFRSLKWYRMIPAFLFYGFWLQTYLLFSLHALWVEKSSIWTQLALIAVFWGSVAFYGDYLDFQRFFPLMRSGNRLLRLVGRGLFLVWLLGAVMICALMEAILK